MYTYADFIVWVLSYSSHRKRLIILQKLGQLDIVWMKEVKQQFPCFRMHEILFSEVAMEESLHLFCTYRLLFFFHFIVANESCTNEVVHLCSSSGLTVL